MKFLFFLCFSIGLPLLSIGQAEQVKDLLEKKDYAEVDRILRPIQQSQATDEVQEVIIKYFLSLDNNAALDFFNHFDFLLFVNWVNLDYLYQKKGA